MLSLVFKIFFSKKAVIPNLLMHYSGRNTNKARNVKNFRMVLVDKITNHKLY